MIFLLLIILAEVDKDLKLPFCQHQLPCWAWSQTWSCWPAPALTESSKKLNENLSLPPKTSLNTSSGSGMWSQTQTHDQNDLLFFLPVTPLILLCRICTSVWGFSTWWQLIPRLLVWIFSPLFYAQDCSLDATCRPVSGWLVRVLGQAAYRPALPSDHSLWMRQDTPCTVHRVSICMWNPEAIYFRSLQILPKKVKYTVKNCTLHNNPPSSIFKQNVLIKHINNSVGKYISTLSGINKISK